MPIVLVSVSTPTDVLKVANVAAAVAAASMAITATTHDPLQRTSERNGFAFLNDEIKPFLKGKFVTLSFDEDGKINRLSIGFWEEIHVP